MPQRPTTHQDIDHIDSFNDYRMSQVQAMEWLLMHDSDPDIDNPLTQEELLSYLPERRKLLPRKAGAREFTPNARVRAIVYLVYIPCILIGIKMKSHSWPITGIFISQA